MNLCPYCLTLSVPAPPDTPRPHAECGHCHAHPRYDATRRVYVKDGRRPKHGVAMKKCDVRLTAAHITKAVAYGGGVFSVGVQLALDALPDTEPTP